ncbi:MAG: hypothetical protein IKM24_00010 [Clostridia bacterium]|nr:hypothetical protein [Clostridia bacterium]
MTTKRFKMCDIIFLFSLLGCAVLFLFCLHGFAGFVDESFYPTAALRLINGDSLVADEWHLSQFSSLFLYLPVRLWLAINGSADGMVFFLRCLYACIHLLCATGIYLFFRKHGIWAVVAALLFCTQTPMQIINFSYNSLFALFLTAGCLLILTIYENQKPLHYILAGMVYACACVCNPLFCVIFVIYCIACPIIKYRNSDFHRQNIILSNKRRRKENKKERALPQKKAAHDIFFSNKAFQLFGIGIGITVVVCLVFFFATGGTLSAFAANFKHLLTDSEHGVFKFPLEGLWDKTKNVATAFNTISFGLFFLPIPLFVALIADKKRKNATHITVYLAVTLALSVFYTAGVSVAVMHGEGDVHFFSLPFYLLSSVCYILTEKKNKTLFYCIWIPSAVGAFAQHMASNLALMAIGWVLAIGNIAGVFFVKDLLCELKTEKVECKKVLQHSIRIILCFGIVLQIAFQSISLFYRYYPDKDEMQMIENGPYEQLYISRRYYGTYRQSLDDLDKIKAKSNEDDPVLILSDMTWLYLYIDRPFGTYSAWQLSFEPHRLEAYYELNPEKIPRYIYISAVVPRSDYGVSFKMAEDKAFVMQEMFDCKQEKLSRGILLTVKGFKE